MQMLRQYETGPFAVFVKVDGSKVLYYIECDRICLKFRVIFLHVSQDPILVSYWLKINDKNLTNQKSMYKVNPFLRLFWRLR